MENILREPITEYLKEKKTNFSGNQLANKLRKDIPEKITKLISNKERYKIQGSPGKGNWTDCPWIAILDILITKSPQSGFYPVFLFTADMSGIYLSLNQGVTEVLEYYKKDSKQVLKLRAEDFRAKINFNNELIKIDLKSKSKNAILYEAGNIIAKYYPSTNLPSDEELKADIQKFLKYYDEIIFNDNQYELKEGLNAIEQKKLRLHFRIERNSSISNKVKDVKGYTCEACNFDFKQKYGTLGDKFIEAHHLTPISKLDLGNFEVNLENDFAVLCSNCHRMIHRLEDPSDLNKLKSITNTKF
ncbi:MrcB family domain-containing protein [Flavobacterium columnare]|uniref:DUF3578 domain-containing protein n=2 Tax=Flavobacterium TaxID=237 RepID=A0ABW8PN48_9FLAO|nr:DUF3578 domain-containing protein [Flavobacterium columnare]SPE78268.1 HNH endonuclease [Flavobacterium columnare]